jgi:hypothetical protein
MNRNNVKIRKGGIGVDNVLNLSTRIHNDGKGGRKLKYSKRDRRWRGGDDNS